MNKRLEALREQMKEHHLDAYMIPTSDAHQSEYLSDYDKTREYISGFTGSAGTLLVFLEDAYLWTDGRYFIQAEKELENSGITLRRMGVKEDPTLMDVIKDRLKNKRLGLDGKTYPLSLYKKILEQAPEVEIVSHVDLVANIWQDRPEPVRKPAFLMPDAIAGWSAKEKIAYLRKEMKKDQVHGTVIGALEDICYLFNVRGHDVRCNPVLTSYAYVDEKRAILFADKRQLNAEIIEYLEQNGVENMPYNQIFDFVKTLSQKIYLDPDRTNVYLDQLISGEKAYGTNYTTGMKAIKTETEISALRQAMKKDGIALVRFLKWLEENIHNQITEWDVSEKVLQCRAEQEGFLEPSFETIAGYGSNGAIIHYAPHEASAKTLEPRSFLLLDSGGQYLDGTTDITRTISLGELTEEEKIHYTLVLKSHIDLAMASFAEGTTGYQLDTISRLPLWKYGLDYRHGTGHGVGFLLSVHEGPQSISSANRPVPIEENMVTSNEPGVYIAGSHGVRIESLVRSKVKTETEFGKFLDFETLTLCPIDTKPVISSLLSEKEKTWLNEYHKRCYALLSDGLKDEEKKFLEKLTAAI